MDAHVSLEVLEKFKKSLTQFNKGLSEEAQKMQWVLNKVYEQLQQKHNELSFSRAGKGEKKEEMSKWLLKMNRAPYIENPDWQSIEEHLAKMNGQDVSMVLLRRKAKGELVIHGGNIIDNEKIFYVNYWYELTDQLFDEEEEEGIEEFYPSDTYFELVDGTKKEGKEYSITISQLSVMPENVCVSWDYMIKAVKYFFDQDASLNPDQIWREFDM
ncbi:hypothetical protein [Hazenella coriacea]|uniref:Uncharacterized protein n=1 Tax=Hazenella coriacea TaxID=1179467 RepID=A0A4R3LBE4_9BACL|nr:hypothetical protein [Hazenella coriacea]TCS96618.1 hypothetical protein EDD58_101254 [Hazenella coriacea]